MAAAVEIGTAPLAQVNALLLWKRAGAGSRWQPTAPCHVEPKTCRSLGRGLVSPQSSSGAHGHGTAQRWRHSRAERAWAGQELSRCRSQERLQPAQGPPTAPAGRTGQAEPGLSGHRDTAMGPSLCRTSPGTDLQQPQGAGGRGRALPDPTALVFPTAHAPPGTGKDGSCSLTCHHLEGGEAHVVLGYLLEQLIWGEGRQGGCGKPQRWAEPPQPCPGLGAISSTGATHPHSGRSY